MSIQNGDPEHPRAEQSEKTIGGKEAPHNGDSAQRRGGASPRAKLRVRHELIGDCARILTVIVE